MGCSDCGSEVDTPPSACPRCGLKHYTLKAEPDAVCITGYPPGLVVEGPADGDRGRRVEYNPSTGGRSVSETDAAGSFDVALSGPLQIGRAAERHVMKTLVNAIQASGETAHEPTRHSARARDERGEDGLLEINGRLFPVQIVVVPSDQTLWRDLSMGSASRAGEPSEAVELVRAAIEHKASHLEPGARRSTVLALDASNLGALASQALVVTYLARYDDPKVEFNFAQTWIVGPTVASTIMVVAPTKSPAF